VSNRGIETCFQSLPRNIGTEGNHYRSSPPQIVASANKKSSDLVKLDSLLWSYRSGWHHCREQDLPPDRFVCWQSRHDSFQHDKYIRYYHWLYHRILRPNSSLGHGRELPLAVVHLALSLQLSKEGHVGDPISRVQRYMYRLDER